MASPATTASSSKNANERKAYDLSKISNSIIADDSIKWEQKVAVGIRFNPNDQVLASHYLAGKASGSTDSPIFSLIKEVDVYQHDPSDLSQICSPTPKKQEICRPTPKKQEICRPTPKWWIWKKTREQPSNVKGKDGKPIATKSTLVYYKNDHKSNPVKTQWVMKEYMLLDNQPPKQKVQHSWTLCVVYESKRHGDCSQKMSDDEENEFSSYSCEDSASDMSQSDSDQ
ncbi:NAC domain protein [Melia azedarach]|uniref:NAC domain protein n=1 Tax=Melia azedarach TaxID=155640 RepID=A0ACC1XCL1_MELAZ|nr:NAC domain protein [Melia azedarach]